MRSVLNVLCLIVWYVSASRTLFNVFCTIGCYVSVLCTVLNVLGWIVCHVCASGTVWYVFCRLFVTFEFGELFFMCSVAFLSV